jgi:hypothetical protein
MGVHPHRIADLANALLTTTLETCGRSWTPTRANALYRPLSWTLVDPPGLANPPENRKPLTPENAGWVGFDLVQRFVDGAGVEVVVAVPAAVAVGPVQAPLAGVGAVAQLGHTHLGPFGQVRVPRRAAVEDGDRAAADGCFDADLVAKAGWNSGSAISADLGDVGLWR